MPTILGIDPGISGALVWTHDGGVLAYMDMPLRHYTTLAGKPRAEVDPERLIALLKNAPADLAVVEKVWGQKGDGGGRAFTFGDSYGCIRTALVAAGVRWHAVPPQTWKRYHRLPSGTGSKVKREALYLARQLCPVDGNMLAREKDHNRADAYLIALWGRKLHGVGG